MDQSEAHRLRLSRVARRPNHVGQDIVQKLASTSPHVENPIDKGEISEIKLNF